MTVGILGGGQLGRMLALAGVPLGLDFVFLDPSDEAPSAPLGRHIVAPYDDRAALAELAAAADVITYEFEKVPGDVADFLAASRPVRPAPAALEAAQDRLAEKRLFDRLGIPCADYVAVDDADGARAAAERLEGEGILKTRRLGYDGKGQARVGGGTDAAAAFTDLGARACLLEPLVPFSREVSVIAARDVSGDVVTYPLVENRHRNGILSRSLAPAPGTEGGRGGRVGEQAAAHARAVLEHLDYVGVLAIEFFEVDGTLLANELAPRVHNSGHWTIEGAETSQFENHLRAVTGMPLGSTAPRGVSLMLNLIGGLPDAAATLRVPGAHLHVYGKDPRPGRKVGHVTVRADRPEELEAAERRLEEVLQARPAR